MEKLRGGGGIAPISIEIPHLDLAPGEFVAILGDNGSGKSTLLDLIGLILTPDRVNEFKLSYENTTFDIMDIEKAERSRIRRHCLGYVLQTGGLLEFLTIRDNIRLGARIAGRNEKQVDEITKDLDILAVRNKRPGRVSGGQRQLAALARALVQSPPLILADEPTSGLHSHNATRVLAKFQALARKADSSILMVTHDKELAESADRILAFELSDLPTQPVRSVLKPLLKPVRR